MEKLVAEIGARATKTTVEEAHKLIAPALDEKGARQAVGQAVRAAVKLASAAIRALSSRVKAGSKDTGLVIQIAEEATRAVLRAGKNAGMKPFDAEKLAYNLVLRLMEAKHFQLAFALCSTVLRRVGAKSDDAILPTSCPRGDESKDIATLAVGAAVNLAHCAVSGESREAIECLASFCTQTALPWLVQLHVSDAVASVRYAEGLCKILLRGAASIESRSSALAFAMRDQAAVLHLTVFQWDPTIEHADAAADLVRRTAARHVLGECDAVRSSSMTWLQMAMHTAESVQGAATEGEEAAPAIAVLEAIAKCNEAGDAAHSALKKALKVCSRHTLVTSTLQVLLSLHDMPKNGTNSVEKAIRDALARCGDGSWRAVAALASACASSLAALRSTKLKASCNARELAAALGSLLAVSVHSSAGTVMCQLLREAFVFVGGLKSAQAIEDLVVHSAGAAEAECSRAGSQRATPTWLQHADDTARTRLAVTTASFARDAAGSGDVENARHAARLCWQADTAGAPASAAGGAATRLHRASLVLRIDPPQSTADAQMLARELAGSLAHLSVEGASWKAVADALARIDNGDVEREFAIAFVTALAPRGTHAAGFMAACALTALSGGSRTDALGGIVSAARKDSLPTDDAASSVLVTWRAALAVAKCGADALQCPSKRRCNACVACACASIRNVMDTGDGFASGNSWPCVGDLGSAVLTLVDSCMLAGLDAAACAVASVAFAWVKQCGAAAEAARMCAAFARPWALVADMNASLREPAALAIDEAQTRLESCDSSADELSVLRAVVVTSRAYVAVAFGDALDAATVLRAASAALAEGPARDRELTAARALFHAAAAQYALAAGSAGRAAVHAREGLRHYRALSGSGVCGNSQSALGAARGMAQALMDLARVYAVGGRPREALYYTEEATAMVASAFASSDAFRLACDTCVRALRSEVLARADGAIARAAALDQRAESGAGGSCAQPSASSFDTGDVCASIVAEACAAVESGSRWSFKHGCTFAALVQNGFRCAAHAVGAGVEGVHWHLRRALLGDQDLHLDAAGTLAEATVDLAARSASCGGQVQARAAAALAEVCLARADTDGAAAALVPAPRGARAEEAALLRIRSALSKAAMRCDILQQAFEMAASTAADQPLRSVCADLVEAGAAAGDAWTAAAAAAASTDAALRAWLSPREGGAREDFDDPVASASENGPPPDDDRGSSPGAALSGRYGLAAASQALQDLCARGLPESWTVVIVTRCGSRDLAVVRLERNAAAPLVARAENGWVQARIVVEELAGLLEESAAETAKGAEAAARGEEGKRAWWAARSALDARLRETAGQLSERVLGAAAALLHPPSTTTQAGKGGRIAGKRKGSASQMAFESFAAAHADCTGVDLAGLAAVTCGVSAASARGSTKCSRSQAGASTVCSEAAVAADDRRHVILVLGAGLEALPWEVCTELASQPVSRAMSLAGIAAHLLDTSLAPAGAAPRMDAARAFYVLNPGGDLKATETRFADSFRSRKAWEGVVGAPPEAEALASALERSELFLYLGHGAGERYIKAERVAQVETRAAALLMGCSSARLRELGDFAPHGMVQSYLRAGCTATVGNLWDVTDRDCDRFCEELLRAWLADGNAGAEPDCTLAAAVQRARSACRMRYLVGAAPVCYGLPAVAHNAGAAPLLPRSEGGSSSTVDDECAHALEQLQIDAKAPAREKETGTAASEPPTARGGSQSNARGRGSRRRPLAQRAPNAEPAVAAKAATPSPPAPRRRTRRAAARA